MLQQFKIACIGYSQSPIQYNSKQYMVAELLRVKARVMAQMQQIMRERLYHTDKHAGSAIKDCPDERSFVIEPLMDANPY